MNILLTHDDGLETEGLRIFRNALKRLGEVTIISPLTQQSAVSHSITIFHPLFIEKHNHYLGDGTPLYAVRGTPTDCVKLALGKLMKKPDLVISGINNGANLGIDVFYSGTVAAAMEAGFWGITAMAISVEKLPRRLINWHQTSRVALKIIQSIRSLKPQSGSVFNINIPNRPAKGGIKGIRYTAQDVRIPADDFIKGTDPRERQYFWMKASQKRTPPLKRKVSGALPSDIETVKAGYISVTPLRTNLTDHQLLRNLIITE